MNVQTRYSLSLALLSGTLALAAEPAPVADKKSLTLEGAKQVASAAAAEARSHNEGGAIAIVDDGGNLLYLERIDGTFPAGAMISIGKARTAALFKKPTSAFEDIIKNGRTAMVALPDFTPLQGGVPLEIDGRVVGAIGVSGASNQRRDEAVAKAGAASLRRSGSTSARSALRSFRPTLPGATTTARRFTWPRGRASTASG